MVSQARRPPLTRGKRGTERVGKDGAPKKRSFVRIAHESYEILGQREMTWLMHQIPIQQRVCIDHHKLIDVTVSRAKTGFLVLGTIVAASSDAIMVK